MGVPRTCCDAPLRAAVARGTQLLFCTQRPGGPLFRCNQNYQQGNIVLASTVRGWECRRGDDAWAHAA
ncbi:hypothetical protein VTN96DRAFT_3301 [Rasamsonia emersonii]